MTFYSNCDTNQLLDTFLRELLSNQLLLPCLCSSCLSILPWICNSNYYYTTAFEANEFNPIPSGHFSKTIFQLSPWLTQSFLYVPTSNQKNSSTGLFILK